MKTVGVGEHELASFQRLGGHSGTTEAVVRSFAPVRLPCADPPPCLQLCPSQKYNGQQSIPACTLRFLSPPGSHDSFSFYIDEASPVGPEQPETVQNFVSVFGTVAKKLMRKWLATQTMNFTSQLEAGIRFFDLRISTKPRDPENELFFAHGLFSATVRKSPVSACCNDHVNIQTTSFTESGVCRGQSY